MSAATTPHTCPSDLSALATTLGAEPASMDCHQLTNLNVSDPSSTNENPFTDHGPTTGMGFPPPGSGSLNSNHTNPTMPAVPGIQIDGWFPDDCDAFVPEPALLAADGSTPFRPGCTPAASALPPTGNGTCATQCHHDASFVLRIPDSWDGHLLSAGTPGIRDQFASDFILSDYAMEKGWAYVSQDKGNMGANFYQAGCDERGTSPCANPPWVSGCLTSTAWCPGSAIAEWTSRMRQATRAARALLTSLAPSYGVPGVTFSYAAGISNGGYQTRRAIETDTASDRLYDGGVDWEGTLFTPTLPAGVTLDQPTTGFILFNYLPTSLAHYPGDVAGTPQSDVDALAAVGFNPQSQPLWAYHWSIYWGLTQKVYRLEFDPEYTVYTCSTLGGPGPSCVAPPADVVFPCAPTCTQTVPPTDADAIYSYASRLATPTIGTQIQARIQASANTADIQHPLITLHGDQDALLPIKTDSDLYSQMVANAGHSSSYRYYVVAGGNHVDGQFDDHNGVDAYGNNVLRPILPCDRASIDALAAWVEHGIAAPASHTIARPNTTDPTVLANTCDITGGSAIVPEVPAPVLLALAGMVIIPVVATVRRRRPVLRGERRTA